MSSEKYALNWSSHADHLKHSFTQILEGNDFVDVTLSCEGKKIKAHRIILSAFSSYFYDILKDNPCNHPTIVLRDMKYSNISYLLKFMYCGEVQVPTEHFNSFLQTAEFLQISGLTNSDNKTETITKASCQDSLVGTEKNKLTPTTLKLSDATNKRRYASDSYSIYGKKKKDEPVESDENLSESESKEDNEVNNVTKTSTFHLSYLYILF